MRSTPRVACSALDPRNYFIIVPNMLGNGLSSSPSNTPAPYDMARFPNVTLYDNVTLRHRLVTEKFGIGKIKLVVGWSMGAQQTNQWGCLYPDMVERIAPFCGSAKTAPHNFVFPEGVKAALTNDVAWNNGWYDTPPTKGLRGVGRVYAGWGLSQPFYMQELWRAMGYSSLEDFFIVVEASSCSRMRTTCWPCCGPGSTVTSAPTRCSTATSKRRSAPSKPRPW
jgi:homoserine O-acetyltransferase